MNNGLRSSCRVAMLFISASLLATTGCAKTLQVPPEQIRLVEATVTAVAGKDLKSLETIVQDVDKAFEAGTLSKQHQQRFHYIYSDAKSERWQAAEEAAYEFLFAQGP